MKKLFVKNGFYLISSLLFAILLFFFVDSTKNDSPMISKRDNQLTRLTSTKSSTFSVPLSLNVDSNKYFVTGYPEKVKIKITGPAALVTTVTNTQNFKTFADLTKLGIGNHKIRIQQSGLNDEIKYEFLPAYINVNIQKRKTMTFPLNIDYDKQNISQGYKVGKPKIDSQTVKVTGNSDQIGKIKTVVARLNVPQNAKDTVESQAIIEALDANSNTVNVVITPATADVVLPITPGESKDVPVKIVNSSDKATDTFKFTSPVKQIRVFGTEKQLKKVNQIIVQVDTSDVLNKATKEVALDAKLNNVKGLDPAKIKVTITKNN